jgi:hypothetical protein
MFLSLFIVFAYQIEDLEAHFSSPIKSPIALAERSPLRSSTPESRSPRRTPEPFGRASPDINGRRGSIGRRHSTYHLDTMSIFFFYCE